MSLYRKQTSAKLESQSNQSSGYTNSGSGSNNMLGGGRFTNALGAALKRDDVSYTAKSPRTQKIATETPEEQLEELEQKITLTLQAIDANFDHCQRTMTRDVMPKVEHLARLSNELLQASQPWLQFFMAVASADDDGDNASFIEAEDPGAHGDERGTKRNWDTAASTQYENDDGDTTHVILGAAQKAAIEAQEDIANITARFPQPNNEYPIKAEQRTANMKGSASDDDDDDMVDIDADIATPQLTSRFMTQELGIASNKRAKHVHTSASTSRIAPSLPQTPNFKSLKGIAEAFSASAKKAKGTPGKWKDPSAAPSTPLSMMRAFVAASASKDNEGRKQGGGDAVNIDTARHPGILGSALSFASKASSSLYTEDLMPDTSPTRTIPLNPPKSRRIAPKLETEGASNSNANNNGKQSANFESMNNDNDDEDEDDIMDEINNLIHRYGSPKPNGRLGSVSSVTSKSSSALLREMAIPGTGSRSIAESSTADRAEMEEMTALVEKYANRDLPEANCVAENVNNGRQKVLGLVADMEEMLDEADESSKQAEDLHPDVEDNNAATTSADIGNKKDASLHDENTGIEDDSDDELPSPPKIVSNLSSSRVVIPADLNQIPTTSHSNKSQPHSAEEQRSANTQNETRNNNNNNNNNNGINTSSALGVERVRGLSPPHEHSSIQAHHRSIIHESEMIRMDVNDIEEDDNMTIGHMSPLMLRARQPLTRIARPAGNSHNAPVNRNQSIAGPSVGDRFSTFDSMDEDDPFRPTPALGRRATVAPINASSRGLNSVQSDNYTMTRQWSSGSDALNRPSVNPSFTTRSDTLLGSDATATYESPEVMARAASDNGGNTTEYLNSIRNRGSSTISQQLNDSSMTIDNTEYNVNSSANMDGTTTILPTREMLRQAARAAESSQEPNAENEDEDYI